MGVMQLIGNILKFLCRAVMGTANFIIVFLFVLFLAIFVFDPPENSDPERVSILLYNPILYGVVLLYLLSFLLNHLGQKSMKRRVLPYILTGSVAFFWLLVHIPMKTAG